jgi:hypothetical protein
VAAWQQHRQQQEDAYIKRWLDEQYYSEADAEVADVVPASSEEEDDEYDGPRLAAAGGAAALGVGTAAGFGQAVVAQHVADMDMVSSQHSIGTQQHLPMPMS